ncbi:MAG: hypothetical protein OXC02_00400 [Rhodobacteraceae bacterium]|nr:hypothetical protein [Paracoccaceae bacterium]
MDYCHIPGVKQNDALSLEYKVMKRNARREVNINDFISNSIIHGFERVKVLHVTEEVVNPIHSQVCSFDHNFRD